MHPSNMTLKELLKMEPDSELCKAIYNHIEDFLVTKDCMQEEIHDLQYQLSCSISEETINDVYKDINESLNLLENGNQEECKLILSQYKGYANE